MAAFQKIGKGSAAAKLPTLFEPGKRLTTGYSTIPGCEGRPGMTGGRAWAARSAETGIFFNDCDGWKKIPGSAFGSPE
ncbi:MAG TPA: hypothetical protein VFG73_11695 [Rhodanobacteraceae bacterium]|nr:hypothetical protein [Rhodanobacteraceae bacterium]